MRPGLRVATVLALLALAACAGGPGPAGDPRPVASVVPDFMEGDLELAIVPAPLEDAPDGLLHPVAGADLEGPEKDHAAARREIRGILGSGGGARVLLGSADRNDALAAYLAETGAAVDWTWLGREGYRLIVRPHRGRLVVAICANTSEGVLWGVQTLRQITWRKGGTAWVRGGEVRDRPALLARGSKRPQLWESGFKASFAWQQAPTPEMVDRGRWIHVPTRAPGERLDASEAAIRETVRFFREWSIRGSRTFALRFDDVGYLLDRTGGTDTVYEGNYAKALVRFLREVREGIRRFDRGARLYWLPQTYHESNPRLEAFAREIAAEGGLPADLGLVVTGPNVVSERIPAESVRRMRRLFGLTETPALVYDNRGREHDLSPLDGRDPALVGEVDGVFGERGTTLHRITRLDWSWNPEGYRPERSLRLAVRELAGPSAYAATLTLVRALGDGSRTPSPERTERLGGLLREVEASWGDRDWRPELDREAFRKELREAVEHAAGRGDRSANGG